MNDQKLNSQMAIVLVAGAPGRDGKDGAPGKDGKDGEDGKDGSIENVAFANIGGDPADNEALVEYINSLFDELANVDDVPL